jgi:hypothetical protein
VAHTRPLYELAHGDSEEAARLASAVTRTGDYFAAYLDNKPATASRVTRFIFSDQPPSAEVAASSAGPPAQ